MSYEYKITKVAEQPAGMPFAAYYNMDMRALEVEAGFPVSKLLPGKDEVKTNAIKAGKFGSTVHMGSYDSVGPAYDALNAYVRQRGYEPVGDCL